VTRSGRRGTPSVNGSWRVIALPTKMVNLAAEGGPDAKARLVVPGAGLNAGNDTVTVTITSLTPARVKGTFTGTLQPQPGKPATTPLVITDGVFDIGTAL
jgi:hypothetical protein